MNSQTTTSEYLLLYRGTHWDKNLSPEEIQSVMSAWIAWVERLTQQGKVKASQPLTLTGKIVSGKQGQRVVDGPFAEAKEAIGGYLLLQVDDLDAAVGIARECPALEYDLTVEVRPIAAQCPALQRANEQLARARE